VLLGCVAAAALLRFWGLGHGLPNVYNPDESSILLRALSLGAKTLNPHNFLYPSLFLYVLAAVAGADFVVARALGRVASMKAYETAFLVDPTHLYWLARSVSAVTGTLTVVAVYALARKVGSRGLARSAAALMAVAYIPVRDAHFVKHDVPVALIVVVVVLAAWRVWQMGRVRDSVYAGLLAGAAFAFHFYAMFAVVPVAVGHLLRTRSLKGVVLNRRPWLAAVAFCVAFACLSPYVLIDHDVALRDMAANRQIVVGRAVATYGWFGSGVEHVKLIVGQGAGVGMAVAAIVGVVALLPAGSLAAWLLAFPAAFFLFLSNAWPFGRLENPLYPFIAVLAAAGIHWMARRLRLGTIGAVVLTVACMAQPLAYAIAIDRFFTTDDTRTVARAWIERHVPAGTGIAVPTGTVQLVPTRDSLERTIVRNVGAVNRASRRFQSILALDPYPAPGYDLTWLGRGGGDQDKVYVNPDEVARDPRLTALRDRGVRYVVFNRVTAGETDPLRDRVASLGRLVFRVSPFNHRAGPASEAQLPDYDIRPASDVDRPGPIIEIWDLEREGR
jgi:hypothetical protein